MQIIRVKFLHGYQEYSYLWDGAHKFSVGDPAVVDSPKDGFVVVRVTEILEGNADVKANKFIVCPIDVVGYNERKAKVKRLAEIKALLQAKEDKLNEANRYAHLAMFDNEAAKLIQEMKQLSKGN